MATSFIYFLCGLLIRNVHAGDMESKANGVTWFEASNICKEKGLRLEHDFTYFNLDHLRSKQFWIGIIRYEELSAWMEPLGCFDLQGYHKTPFQADSIGLCQHHCNQSLKFSYQEFTTDCLCIENVDQSKELDIRDCLVPENKTNMIVYERYDFVSPETDNVNNKCLVSTCSENKIKLGAYNCINSNSSVKTLCDDLKTPTSGLYWTYNFTTARNKCNDKNKMLLSQTQCGDCLNKCWTRVFREHILVKYFVAKSDDISPKDCFYGEAKRSSGLNITIQSKLCNEKLKYFACESNYNETETTIRMKMSSFSYSNDYDDTGTTISMETYSSSTSQTYDYGDTRTTITMETYSSSQTHVSETSGSTTGYMERNSSSLSSGALIGGIVGGIILIAFAVLLIIIIFIRRKRNTKPPKKNEVYSDSYCIESSSNGKQFSNMEYEMVDNIIDDIAASNKAIDGETSQRENKLITEYSKVNISRQRCTSNNDVYNTASEGEYDKLNNILSRKNNTEINLYGLTGHAGEDEYDTMKGALQGKRVEDLYDTNVPLYGGKGNSTYDTASSFQHGQIDQNSTYGYSS